MMAGFTVAFLASRASGARPEGRYDGILPRAQRHLAALSDIAPADDGRCACCGTKKQTACHIARLPVCRGCALTIYQPKTVTEAERRLRAAKKYGGMP